MTLSYDIARCSGTTHAACQECRRREPGRPTWQAYMPAPIDMLTGKCVAHIGHHVWQQGSTLAARPGE